MPRYGMALYTLSASLKVLFLLVFVFKLFPHLRTFIFLCFPCLKEERHFSTFVLVMKVEPMMILRLRTSRVRVRGLGLFKDFIFTAFDMCSRTE